MNIDEIQQLCLRLGGMKQDLVHAVNEAQKALRNFVTDRSQPLGVRFETWEAWCDKEHHQWVIHEADVPFLGGLVERRDLCDHNRFEKYDWSWFLDSLEDNPEILEKHSFSLSDVMELIIDTNFGSYIHDW